jgi:hypothetical protein
MALATASWSELLSELHDIIRRLADWRSLILLGATCRSEYAMGAALRVAWPLRIRLAYQDLMHIAEEDLRAEFSLQFGLAGKHGFFAEDVVHIGRVSVGPLGFVLRWGPCALLIVKDGPFHEEQQPDYERNKSWEPDGIQRVLAYARGCDKMKLRSTSWTRYQYSNMTGGISDTLARRADAVASAVQEWLRKGKNVIFDYMEKKWIMFLPVEIRYKLREPALLVRVQDKIDEESGGLWKLEHREGFGHCVVQTASPIHIS